MNQSFDFVPYIIKIIRIFKSIKGQSLHWFMKANDKVNLSYENDKG